MRRSDKNAMKQRMVVKCLVMLALIGLMILSGCSNDRGSNGKKNKEELKTLVWGEYDGKEMEWVILDEDENEFFLVSRYAIDNKHFNESVGMTKDVLWEKSFIRGWLNDEFYNKAFNEYQKEMIVESSNRTQDAQEYKKSWGVSGSQSTKEKVFLLSIQEVEGYLKGTQYLTCESTDDSDESIDWWLRSPGENAEKTMCVDEKGKASQNEKTSKCYVRPAIRLKKYLSFGAYEQDNNPDNGKESIDWVVLKNEGNKVFVVSRYVLDFRYYNDKEDYFTYIWNRSSIRQWLNDDFYNSAFSASEQIRIPKTEVKLNNKTYEYGSMSCTNSDTLDNIFLLSSDEVKQYFGCENEQEEEKLFAKATDYAFSHAEAFLKGGNEQYQRWEIDGKDNIEKQYIMDGFWWLRDNYGNGQVRIVKFDWVSKNDDVHKGHISQGCPPSSDSKNWFPGVRPAMWIDFGVFGER